MFLENLSIERILSAATILSAPGALYQATALRRFSGFVVTQHQRQIEFPGKREILVRFPKGSLENEVYNFNFKKKRQARKSTIDIENINVYNLFYF